MAWSRPFGYDPLTGGKETIHFDDDGKIRIVKETDIEDVLARNYEARKHTNPHEWHNNWDKEGEAFTHFASIPLDIYFNDNLVPRWLRNDPKELAKWLQKPEQEAFRARWGNFV